MMSEAELGALVGKTVWLARGDHHVATGLISRTPEEYLIDHAGGPKYCFTPKIPRNVPVGVGVRTEERWDYAPIHPTQIKRATQTGGTYKLELGSRVRLFAVEFLPGSAGEAKFLRSLEQNRRAAIDATVYMLAHSADIDPVKVLS